MNKVLLIGNLGRDPDMNYTPSGKAVTRFSLAVNRRTKSQSGEWADETQWFNITAWDNLAERCNNYLHKGMKVFVEGRLQIRTYTDQNNQQRTAVDVIASEVEFLSPKPQSTAVASSTGDYLADENLGDLDDHPF
ncbi:MAG: single-stranded DNA-binding protein [Ktedonobacteraceae bacterium]|nr:single-stranded DNA-binding protein [Ktedonobacteraceae bacterium]